jgi:streptogramin lyase/lysophospholipase L1-like esterase
MDALSPPPAGGWVLELGDSVAYEAHYFGDTGTANGFAEKFVQTLSFTPGITNYGCPGETSGSFLLLPSSGGCGWQAAGNPMRNGYAGLSQLQAANNFLQQHSPWTSILLSIGGNDARSAAANCSIDGGMDSTCLQSAVQSFSGNLRTILGGLRQKAPSARIVVLNLYNPTPGSAQAAALLAPFNSAIGSVVATVPGAGVADLASTNSQFASALTTKITPGDIHPTDYGYQLIADAVAAAAGAVPLVEIDCGSTTAVPPVAPFAADTDFAGGSTTDHANKIDVSAVTNPAPQGVYQSARLGNSTYTISGFSPGQGNTLRLHFAETYFSSSGNRTFNVIINGSKVLSGFDIFKAAGAINKAVVEQFTLPASTSGTYVIQVVNVVNSALIAGIEIDSASTCRQGLACAATCPTGSTPLSACTQGVSSCGCGELQLALGHAWVTATAGLPVSGPIAFVTDTITSDSPSALSVTTQWGDNTSSTAGISAPVPGFFVVAGAHAYQTAGNMNVKVTVSDSATGATTSMTYVAVVRPAVSSSSWTEYAVGTPNAIPKGIVAGPDGRLWFPNGEEDNDIGAVTTAGVESFYPMTAGINPNAIAVGPDHNVWFTENAATSYVGNITTAGALVHAQSTPHPYSLPVAIASGPDGNMYVAESFAPSPGAALLQVSPDFSLFNEIVLPSVSNMPQGIASATGTKVWFTDSGTNAIGSFNTSTGAFQTYPLPSANSFPSGICAFQSGTFWFTEANENAIGRIDPASGVITEWPVPTPSSGPGPIAVGPDGNLWFAEQNANKLGRITPTGAITEFTVPTAGSNVSGIARGPDHNVWFTEQSGRKVGRLIP